MSVSFDEVSSFGAVQTTDNSVVPVPNLSFVIADKQLVVLEIEAFGVRSKAANPSFLSHKLRASIAFAAGAAGLATGGGANPTTTSKHGSEDTALASVTFPGADSRR